ncbi:TPA: hypothetical protein N0F65_006028 [Lagenidium giganteum]|uniref:DDE-1 domain-containing protein n=1 Tax=Lagenidium giganteum TaxID=4803 RepID=A0AAV2ZB97_9STRA|nr:TPA: hypothetical protein N0F65_006028 [Lagenidium giganteum]
MPPRHDAEEIIATELGSVLEPLPPNSTSMLQPLDVGVLNARLRALWLLEENDKKKTAKDKRKAIITRIIRAWAGFPEETIKRSFEKACLKCGNLSCS